MPQLLHLDALFPDSKFPDHTTLVPISDEFRVPGTAEIRLWQRDMPFSRELFRLFPERQEMDRLESSADAPLPPFHAWRTLLPHAGTYPYSCGQILHISRMEIPVEDFPEPLPASAGFPFFPSKIAY